MGCLSTCMAMKVMLGTLQRTTSRPHEKVQGLASVSYCPGSKRTEKGVEGPPSGCAEN